MVVTTFTNSLSILITKTCAGRMFNIHMLLPIHSGFLATWSPRIVASAEMHVERISHQQQPNMRFWTL